MTEEGQSNMGSEEGDEVRRTEAEQVAAAREQEVRVREGYGTLEGVFVPTLLTILGVIMFLRQGWVVGNAGLGGAMLIIFLAFGITAATGLSMASITTNIRIGAGGAYSIISKSLGLEVGGSVGIPLYLSQALAVSLYIFGFRAGWLDLFPDHPPLAVDLAVFATLFLIAYLSASFAFRVQYAILALIVAALVSVAVAAAQGSMDQPITWFGDYPGSPDDGFRGTNFWAVFAVFFPAATGIMAGANLSADLKDPRRSIPVGTMAAIGVSFVIYLALGYWLARSATPDELTTNYTIMIDKAAWGPAVLAGLLGATFSSALASVVGAPRILEALGQHNILPAGSWLAHRSRRGEPQHAMFVTAGIVLAALMLRDLNAVAPLITMFFLITYAMINVVVLVEHRLGLVSFRPLLRVPAIVPLLGTAGCLLAMFIVNPVLGIAAVVVVLGFYAFLTRRHLVAPYGDVRSGLFVAVAEWAAKRAAGVQGTQERAWRPNLLVPVEDDQVLRGTFRLLHDIAAPKGSVRIMGIAAREEAEDLEVALGRSTDAFRGLDVFASSTLVEAEAFVPGFVSGMGALRGSFFRPNLVFLDLMEDRSRDEQVRSAAARTTDHGLGVIVFADHPRAGLGRQNIINLWMRSPDWEDSTEVAETDLAILVGYKLRSNWQGHIRLIAVVPNGTSPDRVETDLERLMDLARLPDAEVVTLLGDFDTQMNEAPAADLNVFGLPGDLDVGRMRELVDRTGSACLFVRGSGQESALA